MNTKEDFLLKVIIAVTACDSILCDVEETTCSDFEIDGFDVGYHYSIELQKNSKRRPNSKHVKQKFEM